MSEDSCFLLHRGRRTGIVDHRKQGYSVIPCELKEELYRTIYVLHIVILIIKRYFCVPHLLSSSFYLQCKLSMMKYFPLQAMRVAFDQQVQDFKVFVLVKAFLHWYLLVLLSSMYRCFLFSHILYI